MQLGDSANYLRQKNATTGLIILLTKLFQELFPTEEIGAIHESLLNNMNLIN